MNSEMRADVIELIITACEKYAQNYEVRFNFLNLPVCFS